MIKRTGAAPTIRYFDLFLLIDNEKGEVTEFPEAAEIRPAAAVKAVVPAKRGNPVRRSLSMDFGVLDPGPRFARPG